MLRIVGGVLQALVVAVLSWVGFETVDNGKKIAGLGAQVQALEKQVYRIQNAEDARKKEDGIRDFRGISEGRRR